MSLLIAFLVGLTLGILLVVPFLLRRRRMPERNAGAAPTLAMKEERSKLLAAAMHAEHPEWHELPMETDVLTSAQNHDEVAVRPAWGNAFEAESTPILSMTAQQALSPEPVVEISIESCGAVGLSDAELQRAATLLQRGQPEQALAVIRPYLGDLKVHPGAVPLAMLHADIRWAIASREQRAADFAQASHALEALLAIRPDDAEALFRLASSLLRQVDSHSDEIEKAALLQSCIDMLKAIGASEVQHGPERQAVIGEALARRVLLDVVVDEDMLAEAERSLRDALANDTGEDSNTAWWMQKMLAVPVPAMPVSLAQTRLEKAIALLCLGLKSSSTAAKRVRWQAALLHAELARVRIHPHNDASHRLRLRELYARHATAMKGEDAPEVLAAWVDVLCALTASMMGHAALERYREIDEVLGRLSQADQVGGLYATAWMQMTRGRLAIENETGKRELLARAADVLDPHLAEADENLRLQASMLALEQAALAAGPDAENTAYTQALELARPLTAVPSLAVPALRCALKALLAMGEHKERRVYATCLGIISPQDMESLCLLAKSSYRDDKFGEACRHLEMAWLHRDRVLGEAWLDLWQEAFRRWKALDSDNEALTENERRLRQADGRRHR